MLGIFGLCAPSGVQNQVVPRRNGLVDGENGSDSPPKRTVDVVRLKPQPLPDQSSRSTTQTASVEDELALLALDIKYCGPCPNCESYGANLQALCCYSFDTSSVKASSSLVITLRRLIEKYKISTMEVSVQLSVSKSVGNMSFTQSAAGFGEQDFDVPPNIASACKSLTQILTSYLSYTSSVEGVNFSIQKNDDRGNVLKSVRTLYILTVSASTLSYI